MSTDQQTVTSTPTRRLGADMPEVSAVGIGTWALGGPFTFDGRDAGWGQVDDQVSVRALHAAIDHGATLIDTAALYGTGHSERVVGQALAQLSGPAGRGRGGDQVRARLRRAVTRRCGPGHLPSAIRAECEASLRRLGVEAIGLYQLHGGADSPGDAERGVVAVLEELVAEGKIRWFGTSQDAPEIITAFARSPHAVAVQSQVNVFGWSPTVLELAKQHDLAVLARSPLAMGLLSGRYTLDHRPAPGDVRLDTPWWTYFDDDAMAAWLARLERVRID